MIASEDGDAVLEAHFEAYEQGHCLHRVVASVHVVPHEQVVGVGGAPSDLEQLHQVVELAVHVAADRHRALHRLHVHLVLQDLFRLHRAT